MSKTRWIIFSVIVVMSVPGVVSADPVQPISGWNNEETPAARRTIDAAYDAMVAMDSVALSAVLDSDVSGFDIDLEGSPVHIESRAAAIQYFTGIFAWAKETGAQLRVDRHATECHTAGDLAFCTLAYDFVAAMPDGTIATQPTWSTVVLHNSKEGWKWLHWHSSLSTSPASPTVESPSDH